MNNESRNKIEEHHEMLINIADDITNIKDQEKDPDTKQELEDFLKELSEVQERAHGLCLE